MPNRPIRVLHVINSLKRGGAETLLRNFHHAIDPARVQFDYLLSFPLETDYEAEVKQLGGRIYRVAYRSESTLGKFSFLCRLFLFLLTHRYQIIHVHLAPQAAQWPLLFAKILRFEHRIIHSHNINTSKEESSASLDKIKKRLSRYATDYYACSNEAATFLFGSAATRNGKVVVLTHSIDAKQFVYSKTNRDAIRKKLGIETGCVVLGSTARLEKQKNHTFMLQIMSQLRSMGNRWVLVLVGDGSLVDTIKDEAKRLEISDIVKLVGVSDSVNAYLSAFDLLLMPSLHEGLPLAAIEAQAAGLPILASENRVTKEVCCTDLVHFLPIEDGATAWAQWIANFTPIPRKEGEIPHGRWSDGYDSAASSRVLTDRYEKMLGLS